jgi:osmotically inducible protein OsmC
MVPPRERHAYLVRRSGEIRWSGEIRLRSDASSHSSRERAMPTRNASAVWEGGLQGGTGSFSGESGAIGGAYSFGSRFAEGKGSNPEELLAAAEAACYSMALSGGLERNGTPPERIETKAACTVEKVGDGFKITNIKLVTRARVPNIDDATFQRIAAATKDGCPVSGAFKGNVNIELDAKLE